MRNQPRTPPLWRAWVETLLEKQSTRRMIEERFLTIDVVRQVASAESGLARFGLVRQSSAGVADLLQLPIDDVVRARLLLVHLRAIVMVRIGGDIGRQLMLPQLLQRGKVLPPEVLVALDRMQETNTWE